MTDTDPVLQISRRRHLKQVPGDAFRYLHTDDSLLLGAIAIWPLCLLIASIATGYFIFKGFPGPADLLSMGSKLKGARLIALVATVLLFPAALCMLTLLVNRLMLLRDADPSGSRKKLITALNADLLKDTKNYAPNFIIIYVLYSCLAAVLSWISGMLLFGSGTEMDFEPFNGVLNFAVPALFTAVLLPFLFYFGFSALFVSVRDNIGSWDALKRVYHLSADRIREIWLISFVAVVLLGIVRNFCFYYSWKLYELTLNFDLTLPIYILLQLSFFLLIVILQVAMVLLYGSIEAGSPVEEMHPPAVWQDGSSAGEQSENNSSIEI